MNPVTTLKKLARSTLTKLRVTSSQSRELYAMYQLRLKTDVSLSGKPGRVAIVGCGVMGRHLAKSIRLMPGWETTALCDQRPEAIDSIAPLASKSVFRASQLEELLEARERFDVLAVATTAPSHAPIAIAAMSAGIRAILLEKPVSTSLAAADEINRCIASTGARVAVDHTRRWVCNGDGIRRILASGVIGKPVSVQAVPGRGGFAMIGTHCFDFARWIIGSDFVRLRAELDPVVRTSHRGSQFNDPSGRCEAWFANGVRYHLDLSDSLGGKHGNIVIYGDTGRLEIDEVHGQIRLIGGSGRIWQQEYVWPGAQTSGVARALLELLGNGPISCTLADGTAALEAAIAANFSARRQGQWVDLPLPIEVRTEIFPFA